MGLFGYDEEGQIIPGYKGPLSTYAEWHSLVVGAYFSLNPRYEGIPKEISDSESYRYNPDVDKEPHMARTGYIGMEFLKYAIIVLTLVFK